MILRTNIVDKHSTITGTGIMQTANMHLKQERQLYVTYSTFPVSFSQRHGGVISPPKKLQRYDNGDAPEVQSTQPVVHAEVHASVSSPVLEKVLKPV